MGIHADASIEQFLSITVWWHTPNFALFCPAIKSCLNHLLILPLLPILFNWSTLTGLVWPICTKRTQQCKNGVWTLDSKCAGTSFLSEEWSQMGSIFEQIFSSLNWSSLDASKGSNLLGCFRFQQLTLWLFLLGNAWNNLHCNFVTTAIDRCRKWQLCPWVQLPL